MIGGSELQKDFLRLQPHFRNEANPNRGDVALPAGVNPKQMRPGFGSRRLGNDNANGEIAWSPRMLSTFLLGWPGLAVVLRRLLPVPGSARHG